MMAKAAALNPVSGEFVEVPVVDLGESHAESAEHRRRLAKQLGQACENVGFVYVKNHGVQQSTIEAAFAQSRRFFAMPLARKREIHVSKMPNHRGFIGAAQETVDLTSTPDIKEAFKFGRDLPVDDPLFLAGNRLFGPNAWPTGLDGFSEAIEAYTTAMQRLTQTMFGLFALSLDLPEDYFASLSDNPMDIANLLYYPAQAPRADQVSGLGVHTDSNCFTILAQDGVGGLEVMNHAGDWVAAPPRAGTFVINIGTMLAHWTNDRFAATKHRVFNRSGRERYSIAYFASCNFDTELRCIESCLAPGSRPRHQPIRAGQFLTDLLAATHDYLQPGRQ